MSGCVTVVYAWSQMDPIQGLLRYLVITVVRVILKLSVRYAKRTRRYPTPLTLISTWRVDDNLALSHKHAYYYQVETELGVCRKDFCCFVVWTECDTHIESITLECWQWLLGGDLYETIACERWSGCQHRWASQPCPSVLTVGALDAHVPIVMCLLSLPLTQIWWLSTV